uniref:Ground-like domain-containing protein n=1 Tax=Strongyloides venezuelensis TaxID=75913 RepID=A0A0K0FHJ0_STRVS
MVKFFLSTAILALVAQSGNACFGGLGGGNACCPPASNTCAPSVPKCQTTSYAAPPVPAPTGYAQPPPSYIAPPPPAQSGYAQPGYQGYPRPFGVQGSVQPSYPSGGINAGYASSIDSGAASAYVQQKVPSGGNYIQGPGPVGPAPVEPTPQVPQPGGGQVLQPGYGGEVTQPSGGEIGQPGGEVVQPGSEVVQPSGGAQEPGYEATHAPGYGGEVSSQAPAIVVASTEYTKEEVVTSSEAPLSYGGSQSTQGAGYGGGVQVTSAPSYGGSQTTVGGGYSGETETKSVVTEERYEKEAVKPTETQSKYEEQLPSTAAPSKGGYGGEESIKEKSGYDQGHENSVAPSQIGAVDYGEETNTSGDGNCEDPELRAIVEAAVNSHSDNLEAARKIEADAGSKFGGRFNSIVSNSEFAYVNWYGKRNCQLRVKERHTLTWED